MDDLNTPGFIANVNSLIKTYASSPDENKAILKSKLILLGNLMGILQVDPESWFEKDNSTINLDEKEIKALISKRNEAKINKDYEKADAIRDDLMKNGIEIMDSSSGTTWKIKS